MLRGPFGRAALTVVAVASLSAGCDVGGATDSSGGPTGPVGPTGMSAAPTAAAPTVTAVATAVASRPAAQPPSAVLAVEGGDPVAGQLGSYTWLDGGSDSPWLPGTPLSVGAREPVTVTIGDGVAVTEWSARRVPAGTANGSGAVSLGAGGPPVTFAAPGPGTWSVRVTVRFASDIGEASYYWRLAVH
jgi:hypothetical protein